jgi:hypothetical protein
VEADLGGGATVVAPEQFSQAIFIGHAGEMVEGVAQEVEVAALPCGLGEDLGDGTLEAGVIVADPLSSCRTLRTLPSCVMNRGTGPILCWAAASAGIADGIIEWLAAEWPKYLII